MTDRSNTTPVDDLSAVLGTVGDLVNHMVLGSRLFAGVLRGVAAVAPDVLDPKAGDALGDDPVAAYRGAADDLLAAFGQPGVLERVFQVPAGLVPGIAAIHLRAVEDLVHGWDLAQATGQRPPFPDDIVERRLEFTRAKLADVPTERSPFAPPQPVPHQAPPLERLVALLGRQVDQRRPETRGWIASPSWPGPGSRPGADGNPARRRDFRPTRIVGRGIDREERQGDG